MESVRPKKKKKTMNTGVSTDVSTDVPETYIHGFHLYLKGFEGVSSEEDFLKRWSDADFRGRFDLALHAEKIKNNLDESGFKVSYTISGERLDRSMVVIKAPLNDGLYQKLKAIFRLPCWLRNQSTVVYQPVKEEEVNTRTAA